MKILSYMKRVKERKKDYEEEQRYYKIEEVCNIIKKSRSSVLTLIKERVLSARKTGRIWLIPKKSLDD
jgi:excisionase family DNA binding protein